MNDQKLTNVLENSTYAAESLQLECGLSLPEISKALLNMKSGKVPGIDGFPVEFSKCFGIN